MLSSKYRCLFVHIPKTAGQSIEHFFLKHHNLSWKERAPLLLKYNPDPAKGPERLAHLTAAEYVQYGYMTRKELRTYFKFSFVRNPWARIVSEYNFAKYHQTMSFKDFVTNGRPTENSYSDAYRHVLPQYDFLHDDQGNLLVDFIGRFENLQTDFNHVCSRLGFKETLLPRINVSTSDILSNMVKRSNRSDYTEYYDAETKRTIETVYQKDIQTFDYRFGE